jgi:cell division protein FtsX
MKVKFNALTGWVVLTAETNEDKKQLAKTARAMDKANKVRAGVSVNCITITLALPTVLPTVKG